MAYQVTARKWRPQTFAEVVGQAHIMRTLQNALRQGRIAHAYLFAGTRGVGKTTTARLLAKALNCEGGPASDPCNQCAQCQEIVAGTAMDVLEIDGASNRGIDEIRDLREKIRYAPARGRFKIYIIDEVHMLTEHAFNALLKTLEEPPPQVVFIFATTEPQKVPITILSRCQRYDFRRVATMEIAACLQKIAEQEGIQLSATALHRIARQAGGSLRDAQTLFDQVVAFSGTTVRDEEIIPILGLADDEQIQGVVEGILARDARSVLERLAPLFQQGYDTRELCRQLLEYVRDLIVIKVTPGMPDAVDRAPAELEALQKLGARVSVEELHTLFELLTDTELRVRESAHPTWVLEMGLLKLASLPRLQALSLLIARLETLEQRLGGGYDPEVEGRGPPAGIVRESDLTSAPSPDERPHLVSPGPSFSPGVIKPSAPLAPPQAPAPPAISDGSDVVQRIIDSVSTRALGAILEQHCKLQVTEHALEIVFHGNNRMARDLLQDPDTLRTLQEVASTTIGRETRVQIIDSPEPEGGNVPVVQGPRQDGQDLTSLSRASIVRETLELFGGRILDIRRHASSQEMQGRSMGEEEITGEEEHDDE
jgi:DNA polymerase-3 subunit gamma/tau